MTNETNLEAAIRSELAIDAAAAPNSTATKQAVRAGVADRQVGVAAAGARRWLLPGAAAAAVVAVAVAGFVAPKVLDHSASKSAPVGKAAPVTSASSIAPDPGQVNGTATTNLDTPAQTKGTCIGSVSLAIHDSNSNSVILTVTNTGSKACSISGLPDTLLRSGAGGATNPDKNGFGLVPMITLKPTGQASAPFSWDETSTNSQDCTSSPHLRWQVGHVYAELQLKASTACSPAPHPFVAGPAGLPETTSTASSDPPAGVLANGTLDTYCRKVGLSVHDQTAHSAILTITNNGDGACAIGGYVHPWLEDSRQSRPPAPRLPFSAARMFLLKPGQSASSLLSWVDGTGSSCAKDPKLVWPYNKIKLEQSLNASVVCQAENSPLTPGTTAN